MFKVTHYCLLMYLKTLETSVLHFVSTTGLAWQTCLKMTGVKLEY